MQCSRSCQYFLTGLWLVRTTDGLSAWQGEFVLAYEITNLTEIQQLHKVHVHCLLSWTANQIDEKLQTKMAWPTLASLNHLGRITEWEWHRAKTLHPFPTKARIPLEFRRSEAEVKFSYNSWLSSLVQTQRKMHAAAWKKKKIILGVKLPERILMWRDVSLFDLKIDISADSSAHSLSSLVKCWLTDLLWTDTYLPMCKHIGPNYR